jgi:prephenate dehydrogenase
MTLSDYIIAINNAASFGNACDLLEQFRDDLAEANKLLATQAAAEEIAEDIRKLKAWRQA